MFVTCYSKNVLKRLYYDYYFHRQEKLWRQNALKTLPALLNSSNMLACGEDLGLIPACVHPVCPFSVSHSQSDWSLPLFFLLFLYMLMYSLIVCFSSENAGYARTWPYRLADSTYAQWTRPWIWYSFSVQLHDGTSRNNFDFRFTLLNVNQLHFCTSVM